MKSDVKTVDVGYVANFCFVFLLGSGNSTPFARIKDGYLVIALKPCKLWAFILSQSSVVSVMREGDSSHLMLSIRESYYANVFWRGWWLMMFLPSPVLQSVEPLYISEVVFEATHSEQGNYPG